MLNKLLLFLQWFILKLPRNIALAIGRALGLLSYYILAKRRKIARNNLHHALGSALTSSQEKLIVKKCFKQLGLNFIEFLRFPEITAENLHQFVTFHGLTHLENAYAKNKGVLVLTAHIGHWELLAAAVSLKGFNTAMVVKKARQIGVNTFLNHQRESKKLRLFSGKNVIRPILQQLKNGGIVGIVLDQSAVKHEGVSVPFFGRPAHTLKSLAILSLRTHAPVVPMAIYRDENNHHHVMISPEIIHTDNGNSDDETITARTLRYTQWLESAVRAHPEQWIWTHRRWKVQE